MALDHVNKPPTETRKVDRRRVCLASYLVYLAAARSRFSSVVGFRLGETFSLRPGRVRKFTSEPSGGGDG